MCETFIKGWCQAETVQDVKQTRFHFELFEWNAWKRAIAATNGCTLNGTHNQTFSGFVVSIYSY